MLCFSINTTSAGNISAPGNLPVVIIIIDEILRQIYIAYFLKNFIHMLFNRGGDSLNVAQASLISVFRALLRFTIPRYCRFALTAL